MKFTALLSDTTATITRVEDHNTSACRFDNATDLGAQLLAFATNPNTAPVDTPAYRIDPTDMGLRISNAIGRIDLPWRWVKTIGNAL
jgi:hypothetical protein